MERLRTSDFDYLLPEELIAQHPCAQRDASRLMVLHRADGTCQHRVFRDLPDLFRPGDLLVANNTAVIPARFFARRATGGRIEGLFLREPATGVWQVLLKGADRCRVGEVLALPEPSERQLRLTERMGQGQWQVALDPPAPAVEVLNEVGTTPLPPYIRRPSSQEDPTDRQAYQTVFAARPGAIAAPTAGLHFTRDVLDALAARGIEQVSLTLHVGMGTFLPVKVDDLSRHAMHGEWYELGSEPAGRIAAAKAQGRRIVAVGTTSVRVLETIARGHGQIVPASGWTDIFIYPPSTFAAVDALITNFHLPKSTLLMLVSAFCDPGGSAGVATILRAYARAVENKYRFFSYGDAMLIE